MVRMITPDEAVAINLNFEENTISVTINIKVLISHPFLRQCIAVPERHRSEIAESNFRGPYKINTNV